MSDEKLIESMQSLQAAIERSNSLKWTILLGIARGVGAVIGATVLAGLILGWAAYTFDQVNDIPYIGSFFNEFSETIDTPSDFE